MAEQYEKKILFHSGNIYTQDQNYPFCQAMIIADGRIFWLGNNSDLFAIPSDEYEIIDLEGKTVLPGFCDSHLHFYFWALSHYLVDLYGCKSYRQALNRVRKYVAKKKQNEWILGKGWQVSEWKKPVLLHKSDLDKVTSSNPTAIFSKDEHLLWLNSTALKKLKINDTTPDPEGGRIERDHNGNITGILSEKAAFEAWRKIPKPTGPKAYKMLDECQKKAHALGITSVSNFDSVDGFKILQAYHQKYGLKLRVNQYIVNTHLEEVLRLGLCSGYGDRFFKIQGIKIFADGALGSRTAHMFAPYKGTKDNCGIAQTSRKDMFEIVKRSVRGNLNVAIHAIGDKANNNALDAIISSMKTKKKSIRHRVEHCQLLKKEDISKFGRYGIIASVQPSHLALDMGMLKDYWGNRARYAYAFNSLQKSGAVLSFGSDGPITDPDPIWNIFCAVARTNRTNDKPFFSAEKLTLKQAVRAQTLGGAYAVGRENEYGIITIGNYADIVILDRNIFNIEPAEIPDVKVKATLLEGEFVYGKEAFKNT